jgi:FkbM family methyltransferase
MSILSHFRQRVNFIKIISFKGKKIRIPSISNITINDVSNDEPWMDPLMEKILTAEVKTFIDIGANLGHNLIRIKAYRSDIEYIGFEPNPVCVFYLYELIRQNDFNNVRIYPFAISNFTGIGSLELFGSVNDQSASIVRNFRPNNKIIDKKIIAVFNFRELKIDFNPGIIIRIDVEGAEIEVISGMNEFIQKYKPTLICEILPAYTLENSFRIQRQNSLVKILKELGYSMHRITPNGDYVLIDEIEVHSEMVKSNYLFLPKTP